MFFFAHREQPPCKKSTLRLETITSGRLLGFLWHPPGKIHLIDMDDIVIIGNYIIVINDLKLHLQQKFQT